MFRNILLLVVTFFVCIDVQATETFVTDKAVYKTVSISVENVTTENSVFYVFLESDLTLKRDIVLSAAQAGNYLNIHFLSDNFKLTDLTSGYDVKIGGYIVKDAKNKYNVSLSMLPDTEYGCSFFIFDLRGYEKPELSFDIKSKCFTKQDVDVICFKSKSYWQGADIGNLPVYIPSLNRYVTDQTTIKKYLFSGNLESDYISYQLSTANATPSQFNSVLYDYGLEVPTFNMRPIGRIHSFTPFFVVDNLLFYWFSNPEASESVTATRFVKNILTKVNQCRCCYQ